MTGAVKGCACVCMHAHSCGTNKDAFKSEIGGREAIREVTLITR